jgi:sulfite reductase (NADPH) flavoprotein alpha-component
MSSTLAVPPFPDDQLALVRRLLTSATPEQRHWLSGYIAGFQAANDPKPAPAPAAGPAASPKPALTILYGSESGNAEALAAATRKEVARLGFAAKLRDMADTTPADLARLGSVLVIASTWGEGDPPQRAEAFHAALMADDAPRLDGVHYAVLALGDRAYARFCETGRQFDARFAALGAKRFAPLVECDLDYKPQAAAWTEATLRTLAETQADPGAAVIHVDFRAATPEPDAHPVAAEVTAHINLNSSRSDIETYHLELSLAGTGFTYEPGDSIGFTPRNDPALVEDVLRTTGRTGDAALREALTTQWDITTLTRRQVAEYGALAGSAALRDLAADETELATFLQDRQLIDLLTAAPKKLAPEQLTALLRPLPPRYYSVASSQAALGDEAHLLIAKVAWASHGRARKGVASTDAAEHHGIGTTLPITLRPNPHFRLPNDPAAPVIMIGPGTGVAPFRAYLQHREAIGATGRNWLFFGARRFTHDFLYQLEFQDWLQSGVLSRIDLAFSRDQREKIYVQHRMWDARRELYGWLRDGAYVYVCGDVKAMAKDVHAMLLAIIADQSGGDATTELRELQRAGRYLRDVY